MVAADVPSTFPANPDEPTGQFEFDYFVESDVRLSYVDPDGTTIEQDLKANYYVNSNDGSMFFDTGIGGFFGSNLIATRSRMGRIDGSLWKSDGQMVHYGKDNATGTLRAVLVEQTQSTADLTTQKRLNVETFIQSLGSMAAIPDPLPAHLEAKWGSVPGYAGQMNDVDGAMSRVTIYMGKSPDVAPIPTSTPLMGFLAGVFKDHVQDDCNKLAVFTRMETDEGSLEVELVNITPKRYAFDGRPYTVTTIGGTPGTSYQRSMQELEREAMTLGTRQVDLDAERRRTCAGDDKPCNDRYKAEIDRLQGQIDDLQCQALCQAGMQSAMAGCRCR